MTQHADLSALRRDAPPDQRIPPPKRSFAARVALPGAAVAGFLALIAWAGRDTFLPRTEVRVVPVVAKSAAGGGGAVTNQAAGWIEPDPYPVHVQALTEGVLSEVLVLEGQRVEAGQVVARMIPDDARLALARAEAGLAAATADVAMAEARASAAKRDWDTAVERRRSVAASAAGLEASNLETEAARREAEAEESRVAEAELRRAIAESLHRNGSAPQSDVDEAKAAEAVARAVLEAARARHRATAAKAAEAAAERAAAKDGAELRIPERREADEAEAALAKARADRDRMQAERDEAALRLARTEVRASAAGTVMQRLAEPGMAVPGDPAMGPGQTHVMTLYDPARLQVRVDVPLGDAAQVGVATRARVVSEVLPDRVFDGEVTRVVHSADIQKNTLQVKVAIRDPAPELKPEMLARVQFVSGAATGGSKEAVRLFVPERLVRGGSTVWVVDTTEGTAASRTVTLGTAKQDGWVEVTSGVSVGDELIDADPATLRAGLRVRVAGESRADDHSAHGGR